MRATSEQVTAGQAVYSKRVLAVYDWFVLGFSNRLVWRCPSTRIMRLYNEHVSGHHLDVGVGTGYFLDRCRWPSDSPRIGLLDLNPNTLDFASRRLARYAPQTWQRNVLEPLDIDTEPFDSAGLNYLLHCLPGSIESKTVVLDHVREIMRPRAVLFGATILSGGVERSPAARRLMAAYNRKGIFTNAEDGLSGLSRELERRFTHVTLDVVGCVCLFSARC